jgi:hypothetical protein
MSSEKSYYKLEMYPLFLKAGYKNHEIIDYISKRIDYVSEFTKKMDFNIYDDIEKHKNMPETYRDRPVIKEELFTDDGFRLPMIYDIIGFSEMYRIGNDAIKEKIDQIIRYIFTPEYNRFTPFYGIRRRQDNDQFHTGVRIIEAGFIY